MNKLKLKVSNIPTKTPKGMPTAIQLVTKNKNSNPFEGRCVINLSDKDIEVLYNRIYETWKYCSTNKRKRNFQFNLNYKDNGVSELIKYYDNPLEAKRLNANRLFIVRPTQQTKAERQTGVYQLEQIFDIIDGNTAPNASIVVLIDKEFSGLIYCYDGQHQTFSYADAILNNKSFKLDDLKEAILKRETEDFNFDYSFVWQTLKEFSKYCDGDSFTINDIVNFQPKFEDLLNDENLTKLTGKIHFTDSQGATTLMKKLNEHISSHSVTQIVKTELDGSKFNSLLYDYEYQLGDRSGLLSNLIPFIKLFNRTNHEHSKYLPTTFSYDLNSKDSEEMNYDQYAIYIINMIIGRVFSEENDNGVITYQFIPSRKNSKDAEARKYGSASYWGNDTWKTYGLVKDVKARYLKLLKNLIILDEQGGRDYIQNIISLADHMHSFDFIKKLIAFDVKRKRWEQIYKDEMNQLVKSANVIDSSSLNAVDYNKWEAIGYKKQCVADLRFNTPFQLVNLSHVILDTLPSSQSVNDWANAVIDVMTINFDKYFKSNVDIFVGPLKCTSPNRYNVFNELFVNKAFISEVNEHASSSDTSLWSRSEGNQYLFDILKHSSDVLYFCPETGEMVTLSNYHSHHLSFRSKNAQKEFKFWFPLSAGLNKWISDKSDRNLVADGGTFVEACENMIHKCETAIKKFKKGKNNEKKILDLEDSIDTFNKWKRRANDFLGMTIK